MNIYIKNSFKCLAPGLPLTLISRLQKIRFQSLPENIIKKLAPEAEDWMIKASQGQMDKLESLQNKSTIRQFAFNLWNDILENKNPFAFHFPPEIKDRKTALFTARCWQQLLRDSRFIQTGENVSLIHTDR